MKRNPLLLAVTALALFTGACARTAHGELGEGWTEYKPARKIHLVNFDLPVHKGMVAFDWSPRQLIGDPPCASYDYDARTDTETFKLLNKKANRAEIRLENEYGTGSRQFEGYVTFYPPLNDESLFQIWGSDEGATQLMVRGFAANNGSIRCANAVVKGMPTVATNCYGREVKVNVIHLQEDAGNKIIVYIDNKKMLEFPDNEKVTNHDGQNYHKYGCYGTLHTAQAVVKWRHVRNFMGGKPPADETVNANAPKDTLHMALPGKLLFEDHFRPKAPYSKQYQEVAPGWKVRAGHADFKPTADGVASVWQTGHMPVLQYQGAFSDAVIELDFRFESQPGKWAACRISAANPELNPRAYAASVWANQDNSARPLGLVLEHDEWKPGAITTVDNVPATFEPGKWYTLRMELMGNNVLTTCNGVSAFGSHELFGLPKTSLSLGTGTAPHELRNLRIYEAIRNPNWIAPPPSRFVTAPPTTTQPATSPSL
ncbi:MAG: family 16 glycoside hydrolase [Phycisphaerae bacterium]